MPVVLFTVKPGSMVFSDTKSHHMSHHKYVEDIVCGLSVSKMCVTAGNSRISEPQSQGDEWKMWESSLPER